MAKSSIEDAPPFKQSLFRRLQLKLPPEQRQMGPPPLAPLTTPRLSSPVTFSTHCSPVAASTPAKRMRDESAIEIVQLESPVKRSSPVIENVGKTTEPPSEPQSRSGTSRLGRAGTVMSRLGNIQEMVPLGKQADSSARTRTPTSSGQARPSGARTTGTPQPQSETSKSMLPQLSSPSFRQGLMPRTSSDMTKAASTSDSPSSPRRNSRPRVAGDIIVTRKRRPLPQAATTSSVPRLPLSSATPSVDRGKANPQDPTSAISSSVGGSCPVVEVVHHASDPGTIPPSRFSSSVSGTFLPLRLTRVRLTYGEFQSHRIF
jgi:hypothetical protein